MYKIFIDCGHNYSHHDTGSQGNGLVEQIVTFNVGKLLADKLKAVGIETKLSRTFLQENIGLTTAGSLSERAEMANNYGADYFISLHCDGFENSTAKGGHCIIFKKGTTAEKLAEAIYPKLPDGRSEKIDVRNLTVLRKTKMPAVLVEMGFVSNAEDAQLLKQPEKMANAIFEGICDYLNINPTKEVTDVNDIVWELSQRNIITDKALWLKKLEEDTNTYHLARKFINYLIEKGI